MLTYEQKINVSPELFDSYSHLPTRVLFFDIETTGLSPEGSLIYLICVGYLKDSTPTLRQWFAESPKDEPAVIQAFFDFLSDYRLLVHFNGNTFDIPFVSKRAALYEIEDSLSTIESFDILKYIRACKSILGLKSCSQKAVELFMGIYREDEYNGGELIEVYKQYVGRSRYDKLKHGTPLAIEAGSGLASLPKTPSESLLYLLLLHNAEDVEGLVKFSPLVPLLRFLAGDCETFNQLATDVGADEIRLKFAFRRPFGVGSVNALLSKESGVSLAIEGSTVTLRLPLYSGELKYFFENYKDYYYLPLEDYAIHKSAGGGVDKSRRKNATAATCYTKKAGCFIPFGKYEGLHPFKTDFKSKQYYVELSEFTKLLECKDKINYSEMIKELTD